MMQVLKHWQIWFRFLIQIVPVDLMADWKGRCQTDLWLKNVNKWKVFDNGSVRALVDVWCLSSPRPLHFIWIHFCRKRSTSRLNRPNFPVTQIIQRQTDTVILSKKKREKKKPYATTDKSHTEGDLKFSLTEMTNAETRVSVQDYITDYWESGREYDTSLHQEFMIAGSTGYTTKN